MLCTCLGIVVHGKVRVGLVRAMNPDVMCGISPLSEACHVYVQSDFDRYFCEIKNKSLPLDRYGTWRGATSPWIYSPSTQMELASGRICAPFFCALKLNLTWLKIFMVNGYDESTGTGKKINDEKNHLGLQQCYRDKGILFFLLIPIYSIEKVFNKIR